MGERYISVDEAAELLHVGRKLIYDQVKAKNLPAVKIGKKVIRISVTALETWARGGLQGPEAKQ